MPSTYSQLYIQIVFAVKHRQNLLQKPWRDEVFKYMAGIIKEKNQKPIIINGVEDHVHVFVGLRPSMAISDLVRDIKNNSTNFINKRRFIKTKFQWQEGFGAFSYAIHKLKTYIVISPTRKNINVKSHLKKSTLPNLGNLKLSTTKSTCSVGYDNCFYVTPLGLEPFHPFGVRVMPHLRGLC